MNRLKEILEKNKNSIITHVLHERENDILWITFKDVTTGKKSFYRLNNPKTRIYITKDKKPSDWHQYERIENLQEVYVNEKGKPFNIARELGIKKFSQMVKSKEVNANDIYLNKRLYAADIALSDYVIRDFTRFHTKRREDGFFIHEIPIIRQFHLGGLDIETDINVSDDPLEQPVILNTYIDGKNKKIITYALINENYKGQKEIMENLEDYQKYLKEFLINHINNISFGDKVNKANQVKDILLPYVKDFSCEIKFTTNEVEVIKGLNKKIFNGYNPDYLLIYNAQYDINHMVNRLIKLGEDPYEMFTYKNCGEHHYINTKNQAADPVERFHFFDFRNPTKVLDQLLVYYQLRKGKMFTRYSLDATAKRELGIGKLDYSKICNFIGDFPYVDYKSFLTYNIIDTLTMLMIDLITNDIFNIVYKRFKATVDWNNISRSIARTSAVFDFYPFLDGYVQGNNINKLLIDLPDKKVKKLIKGNEGLGEVIKRLKITANSKREDNPYRIMGGLVTTPNLISDKIKNNNIFNIPTKGYSKFRLLMDYDATALYPSDMQVNNSSVDTMYGKFRFINEKEIGEDGSRGLALSLINRNPINIGHILYNLPSMDDIVNNYYNINPIPKIKEDDSYIEDEIIDLNECSITKKNTDEISSFFYQAYKTTYDDKDIKAGKPENKLFFTSSNKKISFSYFSTLVEIESEESISSLLGITKKGFLCARNIKRILYNRNDDYINYIKPKKEKFTPLLVGEGKLSCEQIDELINQKYQIVHLKLLDDYELDCIYSMFFTNFAKDKDISYKVYDIKEDSNLFKVVFMYDKLVAKTNFSVRQSVLAYKK